MSGYLGTAVLNPILRKLGRLKTDLPALGASGSLYGMVGYIATVRPETTVYMMFVPIPIQLVSV